MHYYPCHQAEIPSVLLLLYKCILLVRVRRKQVALMIFAFLKKKRRFPLHLHVCTHVIDLLPFSVFTYRRCSVHINTDAGSSAQKGKANIGKGSFWVASCSCYSLLGTWQPNATPDWSVFAMEVLPQCLNVRLASTLHRYLDYNHKNNAAYVYVHNNAIQNTYTAIFECSYCHVTGSWYTSHRNAPGITTYVFQVLHSVTNKLGKNWSWFHSGHH